NNAGATDIDLTPYTNTDTQDLSIDASGKTISLVDGGSVTVDTDDADADPNNENQTVSAGTGITVNQSGQNFEVVNAAPDQTVTITDGGSGNVVVSGTYPDLIVDVPSLDDADADATNELTLLGSGAPSVTPSNSGVTYVDEVAGQLYVYDGSTWNAVGGNATLDLDGDPNNEIQDLSLTGNILKVTNNAGATDIDLTPYTNTDTQDLSIDASGKTISLVDGGSVTVDTDDADADPNNEIQDLEDVIGEDPSAGNQAITNLADPSNPQDAATKAYVDALDTDDADADPNNEIQDAAEVALGTPFDVDGDSVNETNVQEALEDLAANSSDDQQIGSAVATANETVSINLERGGSTTINIQDADADPNNEIQDLSLTGNILKVTNNAGATDIDLTPYTNTDTQDLSIDASGKTISLVDGGSVTVDTDDADADPNNEIQDLEDVLGEDPSAGNQAITNLADPSNPQDAATKAYVDALDTDDADADPNNEIQDLSLTGNILKVTNNAGATDIDLTPYTNTDTQDLSIDASGKTISLVDGGSVTVDTDDADADPNNEIQDLSLTGNILKVTNNAGATDIDLTPYTNTDTQDLSIDASGKTISLVDGGSVTVDTDDADADPNNEIQDLEDVLGEDPSAGNQAITNLADPSNPQDAATKAYVDALDTDDADADPNNEIQDLSLTGNILKVTNNAGATDIDLTPYTNTDTQDLSIDASGKTISLIDGGSVTVDTDDADADPNNEIQDLEDVLGEDPSAGNQAITNLADPSNPQDAATKAYVDALDTDDADADPNNEIQDLSLTGNILKVTNNAGATDIDLT
ncbi:beta strand repeat-containing protein, partial [Zobellia uliginosa]|uniref:beta strand repeat-containing protein n=1 Tax=Zobellia uliginosa TaxID=143224 RepID=UPI0026E450BC